MSQATFSEQCRTIDGIFADILGHNANIRRVAGALAVQTAIDVADKFELWKGNSGSAHPPDSILSLEAHIRSAPHLRAGLQDLLTSLQETLQDAINIIIGLRDNHTFFEEVYDEVDQMPEDRDLADLLPVTTTETTELEDLLEIASDTIGSLLKLIILVRKATPRDGFARTLQDQHEPFSDSFDINYVRERYPKLDKPESKWLLERLGRAITIRRQFLCDVREHKEQLTDTLHQPESLGSHSEKASTLGNSRSIENNDPLYGHAEDVASYISVGTSVALPPEDARLQLPSLADIKKQWLERNSTVLEQLQQTGRSEEFFECPLCARVISIKDEQSWKIHVHEDLKSYVCCLGKGTCDSKMFGDQQEWFSHELESHRRQWICVICKQGPFQKVNGFNTHLLRKHSQLKSSKQAMDALKVASQCPVKSIPSKECPFCNDWDPRPRRSSSKMGKGKSKAILTQEDDIMIVPNDFRRHVAAHLEQVAILAIPREFFDLTEPSGESNNAHIAQSSRSSLASTMETQDFAHPEESTTMEIDIDESGTHSKDQDTISEPQIARNKRAKIMNIVRSPTPGEPSKTSSSQAPIPPTGSISRARTKTTASGSAKEADVAVKKPPTPKGSGSGKPEIIWQCCSCRSAWLSAKLNDSCVHCFRRRCGDCPVTESKVKRGR